MKRNSNNGRSSGYRQNNNDQQGVYSKRKENNTNGEYTCPNCGETDIFEGVTSKGKNEGRKYIVCNICTDDNKYFRFVDQLEEEGQQQPPKKKQKEGSLRDNDDIHLKLDEILAILKPNPLKQTINF